MAARSGSPLYQRLTDNPQPELCHVRRLVVLIANPQITHIEANISRSFSTPLPYSLLSCHSIKASVIIFRQFETACPTAQRCLAADKDNATKVTFITRQFPLEQMNYVC